jgi:hypothetical protein
MSDPKPTLEELRLEHFAPLVRQTCQIVFDGDERLPLVVEEAAEVKTAQRPAEGQRKTFSVTFRGPVEPRLGQQIYAIEHPDLGRHDIFLVPVNETPEGRFYEAVFT